jgi:hypothetical protein
MSHPVGVGGSQINPGEHPHSAVDPVACGTTGAVFVGRPQTLLT